MRGLQRGMLGLQIWITYTEVQKLWGDTTGKKNLETLGIIELPCK